jgi:D-alanyl-D-alanine carboxypeptidase
MFETRGVSRGFRVSIFGLVAAFAVLTVAPDSADARRYRKQSASEKQTAQTTKRVSRHGIRGNGYSPPFASIVVDANTGKTLDEKNPDSLRHPASLTKIMTLYLLFERLEAGKIKLTTTMPVSEHAAGQNPTKLNLRTGSSIEVEQAIRGLVTRSANDAAVVIAEALGGDEETFAEMMTAKARALGMSKTTYKNASGLPDDDQVTTARDQALLGRAVQEHFPKYYRYFSTTSFTWRGEEIRNHNHLLGRVEGVDGIKTGYTHDSGFNLVTSVRRGDRHIVAVVLGGSSAGSRDAKMRDLIEDHIAEAATRRTATQIAEAPEAVPAPTRTRSLRPAQAAAPAPAHAPGTPGFALSSAGSVPTAPSAAATVQGPAMGAKHPGGATGSTDPIKPIAVKTVKVKLAPSHTASLAPAAPMIPVEETTAPAPPPVAAAPAPVAPAPAPLPPAVAAAKAAPPQPETRAPAAPVLALQAEPAKPAALAVVAAVAEPKAEPARTPARSGWIVQVGAFGSEAEAKQHLDEAQSKAKSLLGRADPFTETVTKGDKTYYRARFAGLDRDKAEAACKALKKSEIACMTIKN